MYELIDAPEDSMVAVRIPADIRDPETRELVELIRGRFELHGPVRLLIVYEADPGLIGAETLYENMRFVKLVSGKLSKLAVIGQRAYEDTWVGLFGLFGGIRTNFFSPEESGGAWAWLQSA